PAQMCPAEPFSSSLYPPRLKSEQGYPRALMARFRWAACLARLPQIDIEHQRRARLRVLSTNIRVQRCPSQALTFRKFSSHTTWAIACAIGNSNASGDRHRRRELHTNPEIDVSS